jgi:hypothetical protein
MSSNGTNRDEDLRLPMIPWCGECWDRAADGTQEERDHELPEECENCGSTEVFWI